MLPAIQWVWGRLTAEEWGRPGGSQAHTLGPGSRSGPGAHWSLPLNEAAAPVPPPLGHTRCTCARRSLERRRVPSGTSAAESGPRHLPGRLYPRLRQDRDHCKTALFLRDSSALSRDCPGGRLRPQIPLMNLLLTWLWIFLLYYFPEKVLLYLS